jgi:hypothetical protein
MSLLPPLARSGVLIAAACLSLAACQQQAPPPAPVSQEPALQPRISDPVPSEPERQAAVEPAPVEVPAETAAAALETAPPLDLSIPADILDEGADTGFPPVESSALPDLFSRNKPSGLSVSGELLFVQGEKASLDTVNGASVTIKVPVK